MIKIEFPADRTDIALAIGQALVSVGSQTEAVLQKASQLHAEEQLSKAEALREQSSEALEQAEIIADDTAATLGHPEEYGPNVAPSADIETGSTTPADAAGASQTATDGGTDQHGVAFNAEYCAKAKEPFYTSGKRSGQWKKRKGVADEKYDEWYASERFNSQAAEVEQEPAEVFGEQQDAMAAQVFGQAEPQAEAEWAPSNTGELLNWVAEQQAAGTLTAQQVQDMYVTLQLPFSKMADPANCVKAYNFLKGLI
jgi:hypothetical protein